MKVVEQTIVADFAKTVNSQASKSPGTDVASPRPRLPKNQDRILLGLGSMTAYRGAEMPSPVWPPPIFLVAAAHARHGSPSVDEDAGYNRGISHCWPIVFTEVGYGSVVRDQPTGQPHHLEIPSSFPFQRA